jgi:hypothetical protein
LFANYDQTLSMAASGDLPPLVQLPTRPFLDNFRAADDTELTLQALPDHNRSTEGDFTLLFSSN